MTLQDEEPKLRKVAHPTAKAFFDALDTKNGGSKQSETLKRRSQSLGWRNRYSQDDRYPISLSSSSFSVHQVQRGEIEGTYGTGATVWPAAMVLVKYLERHPSLVADRRVVDLGTGTGITSLAAAILGASSVVSTDGEAPVVQLARDNILQAAQELSSSTTTVTPTETTIATINDCPIRVQKYWWGSTVDPFPDDACQLVLVADCVLPKLYPIAPLVQAIDELLTTPEAKAILSYEHRYYPDYDPRDKFRELATERGLQVETIDPNELHPIYSVDDIEIWHVTRPT